MRTLLTIVLAMSLVGGMAHAQTQYECYSWEDTGTVLGTWRPDLLYFANTTDQAYEGIRSLEVWKTGADGTVAPEAYVAWVENLSAGDVITATIQAYGTEDNDPRVRFWGHYTQPDGTFISQFGPTTGLAYSQGAYWVELESSWTWPTGREGQGLMIKIRTYNSSPFNGSNYVDYLCVTAPSTATINFPTGDFNQPPVVTNVYHRSLLPEPNDPVTVYADATDADGTIEEVKLWYRVNGGSETSAVMAPASGNTYTGGIPGQADGSFVEYYVEAKDNDGDFGRNPSSGYYSYTVAPEVITDIGDIHENYAFYEGQVVKVEGQVYIPGDYQQDGTSVNAYIQGTDGRGLNVFGTVRSTGMEHLNDTVNIVKVTGRVSSYSTVQLQNYEVEFVMTAVGPLMPVTYSTGVAAQPDKSGNYIKTLGVIQSIVTTGGTNPAHNFTIDDGSGPIVIRVDNDLEPDMPNWAVGEGIEAAGAGGFFGGDYQIVVGLASDLAKFADTTPPTLLSAVLYLPTKVRLTFSEPVSEESGLGQNYVVYPTASPGTPVTVDSAVFGANQSIVILTLLTPIDGVPHTVQVWDIEDLFENVIVPNPTIASIVEELMQVACYGWEDGGTILGAVLPDQLFTANTDAQAYEGTYSLQIYELEGSGTPAGFVAWIPELFEGDDVHASIMTLDLVDGGGGAAGWPSVRIWGMWTEPGETVYDAAYSAGGNLTYSGGATQWVELDHNWTVGQDQNGYGLRIEIRTYNGEPWTGENWVDNLCVTAPAHATIVFPGPLTSVPEPMLATALRPNYPNPFNPATTFSFSLENDARVELTVFDLRGRKVRTVVEAQLTAGDYTNVYSWDGRDDRGRMMTSGTYFYRLTTGDGHVESRKMTLLK